MTRPKSLIIRTPEDILALVPFVLGFLPEDSAVLLTAGEVGEPFHARIDLPDDPADLDLVVGPLVDAAHRNGARQAMLVLYTHDDCLAHEAVDRLERALAEVGAEVMAALRADAGHYVVLGDPLAQPRPYDVATHPIAAQAVFEGRVTYRTRQALSDSLVTRDPEAVEAVADLCDEAVSRLAAAAPVRPRLVAEGQWARERVRRLVAEPGRLSDDELARLLVALVSVEVRDVLWAEIGRRGAQRQVEHWTDVVRRCPSDYLAAPAALLAFSAWMAGDGALAWCALDRCREADPGYSMAALVAASLQAARPPSSWTPIDPSSLSLFAG